MRKPITTNPAVELNQSSENISCGFSNKEAHTRVLAISMKSTVGDLTRGDKLSWQIEEGAAKAIFAPKQFSNLSGAMESGANIETSVIKDMKMLAMKSNLPFPVGLKITGVEPSEYVANGPIGTGFSMVIPPETDTNIERLIQKNDISVASSFASEFPGYGPQNIDTKGIVAAPNGHNYFIDSKHPLMAVVNENAAELQLAHIQPTSDGLFNISSHIVQSLMPPLKVQVQRQLPTTNLKTFRVEATPTDCDNFAEAFHKQSFDVLARANAISTKAGKEDPSINEATLRQWKTMPCRIDCKIEISYHTLEDVKSPKE